MRESEKNFCDDALRYGNIIEEVEFTCDGIAERQYTISYDGVMYLMTKCNGVWIYIHKL